MKKVVIVGIIGITVIPYLYCMNKEIEFKFQLNQKNSENFFEWLEVQKETTDKGIVHHIETYFKKSNDDFNTKTIRIRTIINEKTNSSKYTWCCKHRTNNSSERLEFESEINKPESFINYYKHEGYEAHKTSKTRHSYMYADTLEIVKDKVTSLGNFIEIELKKEVESVEEGEQLITDFLKKAGVKKIDRYYSNYIEMVTNKEKRNNHNEISLE